VNQARGLLGIPLIALCSQGARSLLCFFLFARAAPRAAPRGSWQAAFEILVEASTIWSRKFHGKSSHRSRLHHDFSCWCFNEFPGSACRIGLVAVAAGSVGFPFATSATADEIRRSVMSMTAIRNSWEGAKKKRRRPDRLIAVRRPTYVVPWRRSLNAERRITSAVSDGRQMGNPTLSAAHGNKSTGSRSRKFMRNTSTKIVIASRCDELALAVETFL